jgi:RNA polymerase sigma factor (sigma-70 family)
LRYEPLQEVRQPELLDTFFRALEALPERHREILLRHQVDGVMLRDIAKEQGISAVRVSQLRAIALNKVLAALDE